MDSRNHNDSKILYSWSDRNSSRRPSRHSWKVFAPDWKRVDRRVCLARRFRRTDDRVVSMFGLLYGLYTEAFRKVRGTTGRGREYLVLLVFVSSIWRQIVAFSRLPNARFL